MDEANETQRLLTQVQDHQLAQQGAAQGFGDAAHRDELVGEPLAGGGGQS